ncbi:MAG: Na(+)-translocating NADH-quinone reductase subunit C [Desulfobulbaceae bacterium]|nr:MAG: Na(+)-translocating NADH-quinone reductase subunit C [Desulfobulbaceae bacterium]
MANEHPLKPFYSVLVLAFACSALVAMAAVGLKPYQQANRSLDQKKNILSAAGIFNPEEPITEQFSRIETRILELATGAFVPTEQVDPTTYNQLEAALTDSMGSELTKETDLAGIRRLENYSPVYLVTSNGELEQIVLPVRGKGLWSTMYAYVAIESDLSSIRGVSFYEHGETPGLGGEIANPIWQARWQDKQIYGESGDVELEFVKNRDQFPPESQIHLIDGISGATLTTQGVDKLMKFWFGEHGFMPFLARLRKEGYTNG